MEKILYVFLIFALLIGGLVLQIEVSAIDTTLWNFTGSGIARPFIQWSGAIVIVVGSVLLIMKGRDKD